MASYLSAIRTHPWVVALITVAAVGAAAAFLATRTPSYEATADLLVDALPQEDQVFRGLPLIRDTGDPVRTAQTAASLVESRATADLTAQKLGGDWTGESVLNAVQVEPRGESNILGVTATADDPEEAARVANEFVDSTLDVRQKEIANEANAEIAALDTRLEALPRNEVAATDLISQRDQLQSLVAQGDDPSLGKSQEAVPPSSASGTSSALVLVLALMAGLALGSGAAILMELLARRVRDEDDALALYPAPVLARIPALSARKRSGPPGATWYMPPEIREPFRTLAVQLDEREKGAVMVTSPSAGDGKTTTAVNLAVSLAASGKSVVLLDFDLRKPQLGVALGLDDGKQLADLLGADPLESLLQTASHLGSMKVLALSADSDMPGLIEAVGNRLPELLAEARAMADYVVIDTAPLGEVGDALRLVHDVDEIVVVVRPKNTAQSHLEFLRDLLERTGSRPTGYVILSRNDRAPRGYYGYGYVQQRPDVASSGRRTDEARP